MKMLESGANVRFDNLFTAIYIHRPLFPIVGFEEDVSVAMVPLT